MLFVGGVNILWGVVELLFIFGRLIVIDFNVDVDVVDIVCVVDMIDIDISEGINIGVGV
jgi:hypothetical protein